MCGIAGFHSLNPEHAGASLVKKMIAKSGYRGPDQSGVKSYDHTTLGMARLSIVDTAQHTIPYEDREGRVTLVFNGEIYNHEDIRAGLGSDCRFDTDSDAETLLYAYLKKGISFLDDLNGMYAIALHDRVDDCTYVIRDKAGEKPVYYTEGPDFIAFASEIKSLLELVEPQLNSEEISYRAYEFSVGKATLFKGIYQLEPGDYLKIKDGRLEVRSYWKVWEHLIDTGDDLNRVRKDLTELLEDAILLRTKNCAHQYGCFVSGGVDSALVACIAKPDFIYTCHYNLGPEFDELQYAQMVAKHIGRELVVVEPGPDDFTRVREDIAFHLDTPCTWTSFSLWMLLERARQDIKVVMAGDGADEIFSGYHRYHLLNHDEQIHKLKAMEEYQYLINKYYGSPIERYAKLVNRCDNIYDREVGEYLLKNVGQYFNHGSDDVVHSMGLCDFYSTMQVLLQMSDRMTMAFSIENRSPFLDYRLIQYAYSMPSSFKIRDGITKWILKDIAGQFIPKAIVERTDKRGFSAPVNRWFGWDQHGKYNRSVYRNMVLEDWKKVFGVA